MFLAMCPFLHVSYSVCSEFILVFNIACSSCSQLEWKYCRFCSIAPGEESCNSKCPNLAAKISTHGCCCPPQTGRDGGWHLNYQEEMSWNSDEEKTLPHPFRAGWDPVPTLLGIYFLSTLKGAFDAKSDWSCFIFLSMHLIWFSWDDVQKHPNASKCCQWDNSTGSIVSIRL